MKNFKSYGFWTALSGAVVVLINSIGKCFGFAVEEEIVTNIVMAIAGVLVLFGVVSMPKKDENSQQEENDAKHSEEMNEEESQDKQEEIK